MATPPTIESLCATFKNEDVHSQHVARLATVLFDAVYVAVKLPPGLRQVLRAAALLHDIGYAHNPYEHHEESAWIIVKKGVAGFTDEQCGTIAATVLLHRKDYAKTFSFPLFRDIETKETALRLGAILRIADGLDHGHIQNTTILSVKQTPGAFLCACASPGYRGNIPWAQAKADLWKRMFSKEIRIVEEKAQASGTAYAPKYAGIVRSKDTLLDAARRLMFHQYRIIGENYDGMLAAQGEDPLHDARIAIRRLRSLLRLFTDFLPESSKTIDGGLAALALRLSPLRDNDVWIGFLSRQRLNRHFAGGIDFVHYCAVQSRMKKDDKRTVRAILSTDDYTLLMRAIARMLRIEMPEKIRSSPPIPLGPFASRMLGSLYFKTLSHAAVKREYDVKKMHALRKVCRRGRYWSEFMGPLLGRPAELFAHNFKALADTLGDLHDTDTALARIAGDQSPVTLLLSRFLRADKAKLYSRYRSAWRTFSSNSMLYAATSLSHEADLAGTRLYLVRHATTFDNGDPRRALSREGIKEARILARALSLLHCSPQTIASSRLVRAIHTAEFLAQAFSYSAPLVRKQCLMPGVDTKETVAWLKSMSGKSFVCVGHMPHLSQLAQLLLKPTKNPSTDFKKASACCIFFEKGIAEGCGTLEWYFPQKQLERIVKRITRRK
jgi:CHAD domain-containing protein/phosphohistidine phosphatase SixA